MPTNIIILTTNNTHHRLGRLLRRGQMIVFNSSNSNSNRYANSNSNNSYSNNISCSMSRC